MNQALDLTTAPLRRALLRLSVPLMGSMILETLFNIVNGFWVGKLGTQALAAVNVSSFSVWLLFALAGIVATGTNALVAQQLGAQKKARAAKIARLGILSSLVLGVSMAVPVQALAFPLLRWQAGSGADVRAAVELGAVYLKTVFAFAPIFCLNETFSAILRAHGDTRTPLRVYTLGFGLNFLLDPPFILGLGPFPGQGVWGAALASGISFTVMSLVYGYSVLRRPTLWQAGSPGIERLRGYWLVQILRIGAPPSLSSVFFCLVYMFVTPVVGTFGPSALAALGVGHRVESLGYLICYGFSLASITLVGQNVGAGQWKRARQAGWEACRLGATAMLGVALLVGGLAPWLARIFSQDPLVIAHTTSYLRFMALGEVPMSLGIILQGVFSGAGRPLPPTVLSMITTALRVPLAYFFARTLGWGLTAIWGVIVALTWIQGLLTLAAYTWRPQWLGIPLEEA